MQPESTPSRYSRWPFILAGLTAVAGICISLQIRSRIAQAETAAARLTAETLRINTEQEIAAFAEVLDSVRALHALSDAVNQAAMEEFIEKGMVHQRTVLGAFGLAQKINHPVRLSLESQAGTEQSTSYRVLKQAPDKTWVPSEEKPLYYPLTWQNQTDALNIPIGFDFYSLTEASRAIEQIEQTRRTTLVQSPVPFSLSESPSYWVFSPVMIRRPGKTVPPGSGLVIGFAVAELRPETILNRVAERFGLSSGLRLTPVSATNLPVAESIELVNGVWHYRHPLEAVESRWVFECSLPANATGQRSVVAFMAGLVITALMTSQLLFLGGRTRKIEATVRARTEDLRIANARQEENLQERARLEEQINELAAHERRRIGRDLHDSLGQKLTGAVFLSRFLLDYFSNIEEQMPEDGGRKTEDGERRTEDGEQKSDGDNRQPKTGNLQFPIDNCKAHARTLNETLKSAVSQVRNMARGLAPIALNDESLKEALTQLAEEMTSLYGVSCEVTECVSLPELDRKTKEQLYLIAREAVNNAARHAQAGRVTVSLTGRDSDWILRITDDGKGLPENQPAGDGMGTRIMRHRAGLIGAAFAMTSAPQKGTCVEVARQTIRCDKNH